ncbi:MAG: hypothetical protein FJ026_04060 [Chloroflexi bacterium]|nr:hypothetical protein [Chloroflexota bacterium]
MFRLSRARLFAVVLILVTSVACGPSPAKELSEAVEQPTATAAASVAESTKAPNQTARPTATVKSTEAPPTLTPKPEPIRLIAQGFGQDGRAVGFAFVVENPNQGLAIENSQYQIAAYDAGGAVVKTDSGYITLLWPSQRVGVGGSLYLDEEVVASRIEVQVREGKASATDPVPTFTVDAVTYHAGDYTSYATGVIASPYDRDVTDLRVSAVPYNSAGEIIGGGFTFLNFILANSTTGVKVTVTGLKEVASVELYPVISGLSIVRSVDALPSGVTNLVLAKHGFGQDEWEAGYGILIENPNESFAVENSQYHLTAYREDGAVVAVEEGYVQTLLPRQTLGVGGSLYLAKGTAIARADVHIRAGKFNASDAVPFFTAENVTYMAGQYQSKVTGQIVSSHTKDITNVRVSAIAYDETGQITGGGFTYLDFVPANGKAAVEVSVTTAGKPAAVELHASVSSLSNLQ